jgi:hypothetical protein
MPKHNNQKTRRGIRRETVINNVFVAPRDHRTQTSTIFRQYYARAVVNHICLITFVYSVTLFLSFFALQSSKLINFMSAMIYHVDASIAPAEMFRRIAGFLALPRSAMCYICQPNAPVFISFVKEVLIVWEIFKPDTSVIQY